MNNMHIANRMSNIDKDVQRTYNWEVDITVPVSIKDKTDILNDDITLRARNVTIPGSTTTAIQSDFMGMKQYFAGASELEHTLAIEFEEFEDMSVSKLLNAWQRACYDDQNLDNNETQSSKSGYTAESFVLRFFDQNGSALPKKIEFHGIWLQSFASVSLSYGDSAAVKYPATFQWDYYTITDSKGVGAGASDT